jgi:hypothetical protein
MHNSADRKGADKAEAQRGILLRLAQAGDTVQGGSNTATAPPKLLRKSSGLTGYVSAMKKATKCVGGEAQSVEIMPEAFKQSNSIAVKFLDVLKAEGRPTVTPGTKGQVSSPVADAVSHWVSRTGRQTEQQPDSLMRSFPVLAGPAFSPQHWYQGLAQHKLEAAENARQTLVRAECQDPDVSGFPRPSDKLAFAHLEETGTLICTWNLYWSQTCRNISTCLPGTVVHAQDCCSCSLKQVRLLCGQ